MYRTNRPDRQTDRTEHNFVPLCINKISYFGRSVRSCSVAGLPYRSAGPEHVYCVLTGGLGRIVLQSLVTLLLTLRVATTWGSSVLTASWSRVTDV